MQKKHEENLETIRKANERRDAAYRAQSFALHQPRPSRWKELRRTMRRLLPW